VGLPEAAADELALAGRIRVEVVAVTLRQSPLERVERT
jgi:hypothetical protein